MIPAVISATVLPRLAPRAAAELYLTGDVFDGRRAAEIGLVTAAVPADELDAAVAAYAPSLVRGGPRRWPGPRSCCAAARPRRCGPSSPSCPPRSAGYFLSARGARAWPRSARSGSGLGAWVPR